MPEPDSYDPSTVVCPPNTYVATTKTIDDQGHVVMMTATMWCVQCWPKREYAHLIAEGNTLCEQCFILRGSR